jgi:hypothetical protein
MTGSWLSLCIGRLLRLPPPIALLWIGGVGLLATGLLMLVLGWSLQ